jgi:PD-(D/E)XK nuclease superfamily
MTQVTQSDSIIELSGYQEEPRYYTIGTHQYPSVTTILSIINRGYLNQWRGRVGNATADAVLAETSQFGEKIHDLTALIDVLHPCTEGGVVEAPLEVVPHIRNYLVWSNAVIERVVEVELVVVSERYQYAGRLDRVLVLRGDTDSSLWDIKTGSLNALQHAQTAAYALAYMEMGGGRIGRRGVVQVSRKTAQVTLKEHHDTWDTEGFLRLREGYEYLKQKGVVK